MEGERPYIERLGFDVFFVYARQEGGRRDTCGWIESLLLKASQGKGPGLQLALSASG